MNSDENAALVNYRRLLMKVEEKFDSVRSSHPDQFQCARGCHACCKPELTVSAVEARNIRDFLQANPARRETAEALSRENPHSDRFCRFLNREGACSIYEVRPVVCRSHGAPLKVRTENSLEEEVLRDVCPLNFQGLPLESLEDSAFIQLETLNTLLALINEQYAPGEGPTRTALTVEAIFGEGQGQEG